MHSHVAVPMMSKGHRDRHLWEEISIGEGRRRRDKDKDGRREMMETREGRDEGLEEGKPYVREKDEMYLARGRRQGGKRDDEKRKRWDI